MDEVQDSLKVIETCVSRDLCEANIFHALLFKWNNGLVQSEGFEREFGGLFSFIRDALETKYILALGKIFGRSSEASLWNLMQKSKEVSEENIELKLERQTFSKDRLKQQRKEFLSHFDEYEEKIKDISDKINPHRNIQRVHNFPWRTHDGKETWNETREWLTFAETAYVQAMDGICEGCCRVGDFYPSTLNGEIEYFISLIDEGLKNAKKVKETLMKGVI